ncbi:PREDICTED: probable low affinity copper uptake protein 2 isoform X2 [Gavialis gangeticus]|uniref:probable low affinity copper uptake protein 2 isoform X2 n=1 Tax=Gavialis gangeticus TaxID=94835 RepID=UPI00092E2678|nr:PREDICTED: probable low affinity copper uptake protein 2 isoform X2 [Gavialis gangeticus]
MAKLFPTLLQHKRIIDSLYHGPGHDTRQNAQKTYEILCCVMGMALSVVVILLLAALYEVIKVTKGKLLHRTVLSVPTSISQESLEERDRASVNSERGQQNSTQKRWFLYHVSQTLLHVIQVIIGYLVMLAVMSYNTWIFLGVIVGSTVGYYVAYPILNAR